MANHVEIINYEYYLFYLENGIIFLIRRIIFNGKELSLTRHDVVTCECGQSKSGCARMDFINFTLNGFNEFRS